MPSRTAAASFVGLEREEQPLFNPLERLLGYQLRRASVAMMNDLAASLGELELTVTEISVLLVIDANPGITQSDIGRILSIQRANMVPLAARLTRRKLIHRAGTTGRSQALRLTAAGKATADQGHRRIINHEERFLNGMSKAAGSALIRQLRSVWERES